jgi:hypothetical protein
MAVRRVTLPIFAWAVNQIIIWSGILALSAILGCQDAFRALTAHIAGNAKLDFI